MFVLRPALAALVAGSLLLPITPAEAVRSALRITVSATGTAVGNSDTAGNCTGEPNYRGGAGFRQAVLNAVEGDTIVLCGTDTYTVPTPVEITFPLTIEGEGASGDTPTLTSSGRTLTVATAGTLAIRKLTLDGGAVDDGFGGGAIRLTSGNLDVRDTQILGSSSTGFGGAIAVQNIEGTSDVTLVNTTFSGNTAVGNGGAIYFESPNGTLSVLNGTFYNNSAATGAAIHGAAGTVTLNFSTLLNNTGVGGSLANVTVGNSIIANYGNTPACGSNVLSDGGNLVTDDSCTWAGDYPAAAAGDSSLVNFTQLRLGHFGGRNGENFGLPVIRPANGSVAIGFIDNSSVTSDAMKRSRPLGANGKWDAGAIERPTGLKEWNVGQHLAYKNSYLHWPNMASQTVKRYKQVRYSPSGGPVRHYSLSPEICNVDQSLATITFLAEGECRVEAYIARAKAGTYVYEEAVEVVSVVARTFAAPETPLNVTITPGDRQFKVSWTKPAANGGAPITGYDVIVDPELVGAPNTVATSCTSPCTVKGNAANPIASRPLVNSAKYVIRIRVYNAAGLQATYAVSDAITPLAPVLPGVPTYVNVVPGTAKATIRWSNPDEPGRTPIVKYVIKAFLKSKPTKIYKTANVPSGTYKYLMTGLPKGKAMLFKVFAVNSGGTSKASKTVTATIKN